MGNTMKTNTQKPAENWEQCHSYSILTLSNSNLSVIMCKRAVYLLQTASKRSIATMEMCRVGKVLKTVNTQMLSTASTESKFSLRKLVLHHLEHHPLAGKHNEHFFYISQLRDKAMGQPSHWMHFRKSSTWLINGSASYGSPAKSKDTLDWSQGSERNPGHTCMPVWYSQDSILKFKLINNYNAHTSMFYPRRP